MCSCDGGTESTEGGNNRILSVYQRSSPIKACLVILLSGLVTCFYSRAMSLREYSVLDENDRVTASLNSLVALAVAQRSQRRGVNQNIYNLPKGKDNNDD